MLWRVVDIAAVVEQLAKSHRGGRVAGKKNANSSSNRYSFTWQITAFMINHDIYISRQLKYLFKWESVVVHRLQNNTWQLWKYTMYITIYAWLKLFWGCEEYDGSIRKGAGAICKRQEKKTKGILQNLNLLFSLSLEKHL